jgi:hypothetical protein
LPGLHGLDAAVAALEEDARMIVSAIGGGAFIDQRETIALRPQAGIALDEIVLRHPEKAGDRRNLRLLNDDEARPTAAVRATLALVDDFCGHMILGFRISNMRRPKSNSMK